MERQKMDWGWVDWFQPDDNRCQNLLTVGITTILPHTKQQIHRHYGNEQIIYVLSGHGDYYVNGNVFGFTEGNFYFLPMDCEHQTINESDGIIREIVISLPMIIPNSLIDIPEIPGSSLEAAINILKPQLLATKEFPIQILDTNNTLLFNSYDNSRGPGNESITFCTPIIVNGQNIGNVKFLIPDSERFDTADGIQSETLLSTITGIKSYLRQVSKKIGNTVSELKIKHELTDQYDEIQRLGNDIKSLSVSLKKEKQMATSLKINHHFLFNILNHLSALSLSGDRNELYECILDLSNMIRYSSKNDFSIVTLSDELDFVNIYLRLQKRRYGDKMTVVFDIEESSYKQKVPFNILQPIVENAFSHGFMEYDGVKMIEIKAYKYKDFLNIRVTNNGNPIDMAGMCNLNKNLNEKSRHGLNLINEKLNLYYGNNYFFKIGNEHGNTCVYLHIPWREQC